MQSPDHDLLQRWQRDADADAFAEIVGRYSGMVYGVCRRIVGNDADAQEITQDCFLRLDRLGTLRRTTLAAALHTLATRASLNRLDSERRRRRREAEYARQEPANRAREDADLQRLVDEAISALPARQRDPLIARYLEGESYAAIARRLGIDESTVRYRVKGALERVRALLESKRIGSTTVSLAAYLSTQSAVAAPPVLLRNLGAYAVAGKSAGALAGLQVAGIGSLLMAKKATLVALAIIAIAGIYWSGKSAPEEGLVDDGRSVASDAVNVEEAAGVAEPRRTIRRRSLGGQGTNTARTRSGQALPKTLEEFMARLDRQALDTSSDLSKAIGSSDIPTDNGAHYFLLAFERWRSEMAENNPEVWAEMGMDAWNHPDMLAFLAEYRDVMDLIRKGLEIGNAELPPTEHGPEELLPYLAVWRNFARMFAMEARNFRAEGDYESAIDNYMTIIDFGNESSRGGTMIGGLVGYAMSTIATEDLQRALELGEVAPGDYPLIVEQLNAMADDITSSQQLQIYEAEGFDSWIADQLRSGTAPGEIFSQEVWGELELPAMPDVDFRRYFDELLGERDAIIEYASRPYYEMSEADIDAIISDNPLSRALFPNVVRIEAAEARNTAALQGIATAAAIDWYTLENGAYPTDLQSLTPSYLSSVPIDPFTGNPLLYVPGEDTYLLYSAGQDGIDNGGALGTPTTPGTDLVYRRGIPESP